MGRIFGSMSHGFHSAAQLGNGGSCPGTATIFESNETGSQNYYIRTTSGGAKAYLYQSFTGAGCVLDSIALNGFIQAGYSQNMTIYIQAHTGTYGSTGEPTGSALATSNAGQPWSTGLGWGTWTFSGGNRITLTNGTYYCLTLEVPYQAGLRGIYWRRNTTSVHGGNSASAYIQQPVLPTTAPYTPNANYDMAFRVYHIDA